MMKRKLLATTLGTIGLTFVGLALAADVPVVDAPVAKAPATKPASTQPAGKTMTTASGLKITVVEEAKSPVAQEGDLVWVHYTGKLTDGKVFDTSRKEDNTPLRFKIGAGKVIKGWEEGIAGMKIGEKRTLEIPPALGYKAEGYPPIIPGNATLIFDVELVGIARP